jgi:excisionase family DNA binding protein
MVDERWFTVEQIAQLLQVHEQTVRRWLREGVLVGRNFGGRTGYRVRESALQGFLDADSAGKAVA